VNRLRDLREPMLCDGCNRSRRWVTSPDGRTLCCPWCRLRLLSQRDAEPEVQHQPTPELDPPITWWDYTRWFAWGLLLAAGLVGGAVMLAYAGTLLRSL